jgi:hypothetical protein
VHQDRRDPPPEHSAKHWLIAQRSDLSLAEDGGFQQDVRTAATTLVRAIRLQAAHKMMQADAGLRPARQK